MGPLFIMVAALLWSFDGILRRSLYVLPPAIIVFWEHTLGTILLFPFILKHLKQAKQLTKKEWISLIMVSLFSGALGTIFYTAALAKVNYIQFSVVVLLQQLQPVWAILTASFLLRESLPKEFVKWGGMAILASYFVTFRDLRVNVTADIQTLTAAGLAVCAGIMWGASTSLSKIVLKKIHYGLAAFLRFVFASVFALFFVLLLKQTSALTILGSSQWITLAIITLSTGMVALTVYYHGLKRTPAKVSAVCELVWPASAIFIDYFYFGNMLSFTQIIGVAVMLYSIYKVAVLKSIVWYRAVVLKGNGKGREIGFPTLNLDPDALGYEMGKGVYASQVRYRGKIYKGALYFGPRYVRGETKNVLEIFVLDFQKQIYGKSVEFSIGRHIRKPLAFTSMTSMKKQLQKDVSAVRSSFQAASGKEATS